MSVNIKEEPEAALADTSHTESSFSNAGIATESLNTSTNVSLLLSIQIVFSCPDSLIQLFVWNVSKFSSYVESVCFSLVRKGQPPRPRQTTWLCRQARAVPRSVASSRNGISCLLDFRLTLNILIILNTDFPRAAAEVETIWFKYIYLEVNIKISLTVWKLVG